MNVTVVDLSKAYFTLAAQMPTNPSPQVSLAYQIDTGLWFAWNGSAWIAFVGPVTPAS